MKKILLAFDGTNFSEGAFEFARRLNELSPVMVTGIFLPQVDYANLWSYAEGIADTIFIPLVENETAKNIEKFESMCQRNDIQYVVHRDFFDPTVQALKKETRFADLLIIGSESFFENFEINEPNESLKDALHRTECPVLIVPEKFSFPRTNILTYDGRRESIYAIKQFAYLFPKLCDNETLLFYATQQVGIEFPNESYIEEFATWHFSDLAVMKLQMNPKRYCNTWTADRKSTIAVTGAFGRSALSQAFKKSFITEVIRDHKIPVFIAHL